MITKILFTLAVVVTVFLVMQLKRRPVPAMQRTPQAVSRQRSRTIRGLAVLVILIMLGSVVTYLFLGWQGGREKVIVRVIDAGSGRVAEYQAYQADVSAEGFTTVDGRYVRLAQSERMETMKQRDGN